jgi:hypothetical protein
MLLSGTSRCLFSDKYKTHKYSVGRAYICWMLISLFVNNFSFFPCFCFCYRIFISCCLPFFLIALILPLFQPPYLIYFRFTFPPILYLPLLPHFLSFFYCSMIAAFLCYISLLLSYIFVSFFPIFLWIKFLVMTHIRDRDSSVGIATRYGLYGPDIESRSGRDFPQPSRPALGPTQPPTQWVPGLPLGKTGVVWHWPPNPI